MVSVCVVMTLMLLPLKPALKWLPYGLFLPVSSPHVLSVDECTSAISGTVAVFGILPHKCPGSFLLNLGAIWSNGS